MTARPPSRRGARAVAGVVAFAVLCVLVLTLASEGSGERPPNASGPTLEDRVTNALRETRRAERALIDTNYGEVEQHLRRLDRSLSDILDEIGRD